MDSKLNRGEHQYIVGMCLTSLSYTEDNLGEIVDTAERALSLGQYV